MVPAEATRVYAALNARRAPMISSNSGNLCSACFEKIILPSATTSNIPLVPSISSVSRPSALLISAARLEALGRYFQRVQYVIDSFIGSTPCLRILPVARIRVNRHVPMSSERLRVTTADITTLDVDAIVNAAAQAAVRTVVQALAGAPSVERVDFVCFEPRVRAAFERALAMHVDGESA